MARGNGNFARQDAAGQDTVLIADDAEINRAVLRNLFEEEYNLLEAENGEQALMLLGQYRDSISAVLLDLSMPVKNGYEVLEEMNREELLYHIPVVVITADDSADSRMRVFELGASDIIAKPFEPEVVKSRLRNIIELGRYRHSLETMVEEQSARAREANAAVIDMLSSVIEYRSLESGQHIRRIRLFTKILLEDVARNCPEYALDERKIRLITEASSMHDIGKIAIPDRILNKPGRLTEEEFAVMKTHTLKGCEILARLGRLPDREYLQYAYQICRYHHERWDGHGYPDGLKGDGIPICAQVVAIADCYDALTTDRVYKRAISPSQAYSMILNGECGAFSPRLLECFKNVRDAFAGLSQKYADSAPDLEPASAAEPEPFPWDGQESTLENSQHKYAALMRYLDATVMEVDLNNGIYHMVYLADPDFARLRTGSSFDESIRNFAATEVCPEDRAEILDLPDGCVRELFEEGMTRRDRNFRVLDRGTGTYVPAQVSMIRVDLENPRRRRAVIVWRRKEAGQAAPDPKDGAVCDELFGGVLTCRCDRYFTVVGSLASLMELLGFSEEELRDEFHGRLLELVHPADQKKLAEQLMKQRRGGITLELLGRMRTREQSYVWVSYRCIAVSEEGEELLRGVLLDVSQSCQTEEDLRLLLERYDIITGQTNDVVFEWDMVSDRLTISPNWQKRYGYAPITRDFYTKAYRMSHLHPDDMGRVGELAGAVFAGVPYKEAELRIADRDGVYRWCRVRVSTQFNMDGKPSKAVGVIIDIDSQKRESEKLVRQAARDSLTGLYNRMAAQERIETYLTRRGPEELSALMIMDVDNFKTVNDRYGHMFGDAVLVETASKLSALSGGGDTVSRIGGDEFLIFMPDVPNRGYVRERAEQIIHMVRGLVQESVDGMVMACSIGAAFTQGGDEAFKALYDQADRALYRAKAAGKNRCVYYTEEMGSGPVGVVPVGDPLRRTEIDSNQTDVKNLPYLILRSFDLLYDASDYGYAARTVLGLAGEAFGVSRAYIFETDIGGLSCSNTCEWCAPGITAEAGNLMGVAYCEGGSDYRDNFGDDGLFYCQDVRKLDDRTRELLGPQQVLSTLQYAFHSSGAFYGFVGFDDCKIRRLWTQEQIDVLTFVGKLLSVFMRKHQVKQTLPSAGLSRSEMEQRMGGNVMDILGRNIPGGMMGGYLEPGFPLYYVNDLMLSYLDYTYEEFVEDTGGLVINCMHPEDRDRVDKQVEEAFCKGRDYEIRYRMRKKDGSYIWVNDVGKKGYSEDGRKVCISVIRDISAEVEAARELERQVQEMAKLIKER